MAVSRWKKFRNAFFYCVIMTGFPIVIWAAYSTTTKAYDFWKHGVEVPAKVIALDHTGGSSRGGSAYYYQLEINGTTSVERFNLKLPVGNTVSLLILPGKPDALMLGKEDSTWFELFSYTFGSKLIAFLVLGTFAFLMIAGPKTFLLFARNRRAFLDQD